MVTNLTNITIPSITSLLSPNFSNIPPELLGQFSNLIFILKTAGILFIIYICFLIVSSILSIMRSLRLRRIDHKVQEIDKKLDKLLEKKSKK